MATSSISSNRKRELCLAFLVIACAACRSRSLEARREESVPPAPSAKDAGPLRPPLTFEWKGEVTRAPHARIYFFANATRIELYASPAPCNQGDEGPTAVTQLLLQGAPAESFAAGAETGVEVPYSNWLTIYRRHASLTLEPVTALQPGKHVAGQLAYDVPHTKEGRAKASGWFDAEVCVFEQRHDAHAKPPAKTMLTGNTGTDPFTLGTAIAVVRHDAEMDADYVDRIELFTKEHLDCATWATHRTTARFYAATDIGGASRHHPLVGSAQSFEGTRDGVALKHLSFAFPNWVVFRSFDTTIGNELEGTMSFAWGTEAKTVAGTGRLEGDFTATICADP
jgi:hypothetical protein